ELAVRRTGAGELRRPGSLVGLAHEGDPVAVRSERRDDVVGRPVVDDDDVDGSDGLVERRPDRVGDVRRDAVRRDDDREARDRPRREAVRRGGRQQAGGRHPAVPPMTWTPDTATAVPDESASCAPRTRTVSVWAPGASAPVSNSTSFAAPLEANASIRPRCTPSTVTEARPPDGPIGPRRIASAPPKRTVNAAPRTV